MTAAACCGVAILSRRLQEQFPDTESFSQLLCRRFMRGVLVKWLCTTTECMLYASRIIPPANDGYLAQGTHHQP